MAHPHTQTSENFNNLVK